MEFAADRNNKEIGKRLRPLSLRRNFFWTFIGNTIYAAAQWGKLVLLAKLGTPEMVGQFTLGLAFGTPVIILLNLGLGAVQATDAKREFPFRDYLSLRLITSMFAFLIVSAMAFFSGFRTEVTNVIIAVGLFKAIEAISEIYHGMYQQHERMDLVAKSMVLRALFSLAGMSIILASTNSLFLSVIASSLGAFMVFGINVQNAAKILPSSNMMCSVYQSQAPRWERRNLLKLLSLAFPLGMSAMLVSLNTNIPRYLIGYYLGERELGIYAAIAYLLTVGTTVVGALGLSVTPKLAKYYANGSYKKYISLLMKLVAIGAALGISGVLIASFGGKQVITFIYSPLYAEHTQLFIFLMISGIAMYAASFLNFGITARRSFRIQPFIIASVVVTNLIAGILLIPSYGLIGLAWSVTLAYFVQFLLQLSTIIFRLRGERELQNRS